MTKPNGNGSKAALDTRIAAALAADATAPKAELESLVREAETAIEVAKHTIAVESERELDLSNSDPDKSGELVRKAQRTIARLEKALPRLAERLQQITRREYRETWNTQANQIESERDVLAQELSATYPPFLQKLINLYAKIDECDARIAQLNGAAPHGEYRRLVETELKARNLDRFTADQPPLRENLRLPDPSFTRRVCFPPPAPLDAYYGAMQGAAAAMAQKFAPAYSPDWAEAKKLEDQQTREEFERREAELEAQKQQSERNFHEALRRDDKARCWPVSPEKETPK